MLINKTELKYIKNYLEYFKQYIRFKQHYNIELPAEICGLGTRFDFIKVKISSLKRYYNGKEIKLKECAQYQYLDTGDKKIYENYIDEHIKAGLCAENSMWKKTGIEKFNALFKEIQEHGYDPSKSVICIDKNNVIMDGVHRASCLMKLYGEDYEISVIKVS